METIQPVILCGGAGLRLWPASRPEAPKPFLGVNGRSLLEETARRLAGPGFAAPVMVCNARHISRARALLARAGAPAPGLWIAEPVMRNTAPAFAAAALAAARADPGRILLFAPADHHISAPGAFRRLAARAVPAAQDGYIVTFGLVPDHPATGYGYIRAGAALGGGARAVRSFREKPDRKTAQRLLRQTGWLWNSGIFMARAGRLIEEMQAHAPGILAACRQAVEKGRKSRRRLNLEARAFARAPACAFDHAVMEKTARAAVLPAAMGWRDIGDWDAVWQAARKDAQGNAVSGPALLEECCGTYIRAESRPVAAIGVENLAIVETREAVLVVRRDMAQKVKQLAARMTRPRKGRG